MTKLIAANSDELVHVALEEWINIHTFMVAGSVDKEAFANIDTRMGDRRAALHGKVQSVPCDQVPRIGDRAAHLNLMA